MAGDHTGGPVGGVGGPGGGQQRDDRPASGREGDGGRRGGDGQRGVERSRPRRRLCGRGADQGDNRHLAWYRVTSAATSIGAAVGSPPDNQTCPVPLPTPPHGPGLCR